jgi:DNA-binding IclR family transcriptional regulator
MESNLPTSNIARATNSPQSVTRVIHILEALCASPTPVSLANLSRVIEAPKSSIAALLRGLAAAGFVVASEGAYRLGSSAFGLGSALTEARRRVQSSDLIREGMRRLVDRSGETVLFAVRDAGGETITYVDLIESPNSVRFAATLGDRRPLYCTSSGRALLATLPEKELRRYFERLKPRKLTAHTETNKKMLAEEIETTRKTGVGQTVEQASDGVTGTAAVIRDGAGTVIGALVIAAPSSRLRDRRGGLVEMVVKEAANISHSLGYRAPLVSRSR